MTLTADDQRVAEATDPLAIYRHAVESAEQRAASEAEAKARSDAQARAKQLREMTAGIQGYLPETVLAQGWVAEAVGDRPPASGVHLIPTFLPKGTFPLKLVATFSSGQIVNGPLFLHLKYDRSDIWISRGDDPDEIVLKLGRVVLDHMTRQQQAAERKREDERFRLANDESDRLYQERQALIQAKLAAMVASYEQAIDVELQAVAERFGWPGKRAISVFYTRWTEGLDGFGAIQWGSAYSLDEVERVTGYRLVLTRDGEVSQKIEAPTVITTVETWRCIDDVPRYLTECARRSREVRVCELNDAGEVVTWHPAQVSVSIRVLGPVLREKLGQDAGPIPEDTLPIDERAGVPLVTVGMRPDGTFVPFTLPPLEGGA